MNIYESMEQKMLSFNKERGHLSTQLQGIGEVMVDAWPAIPAEWRGRLFDAAVKAAEHFNLTTKKDSSPQPWLLKLMNLRGG